MKPLIPLLVSGLFLIILNANAQLPKDSTGVKVGGAVRTNTMFTIYEGETFDLPLENRNGIFWDTWRLDISAISRGVMLTFEYRFYPGFNSHFLKKGFITYDFDAHSRLELGVNQVPFGMLPYLGNSWWFQLPYYVGLEDDYDSGIKYRYQKNNWTFHAAYYLMAEPRGVSEPEFGSFMSARYSYDIIPEDGYNGNKERNQFNLRAQYDFENALAGISFQTGEVFNSVTDNSVWGYATAAHAQFNLKKQMAIRLQATHYNYGNVPTDQGNPSDVMLLGAYGFGTYQAASEASIFSIGLSKTIDVDWGPIESIQFYEDYSYMLKQGDIAIAGNTYPFEATHHNVLGFLVTAGNIYSYFDIASGVNQPWLGNTFGGSALGAGRGRASGLPLGEDTDPDSPGVQPNLINRKNNLNTRFNINFGYYF